MNIVLFGLYIYIYYRYYNIEDYNNNQKDYYNVQDYNNIYKDKFYKFHRYINKFFVIFVTNTEIKKTSFSPEFSYQFNNGNNDNINK